MKTSWCFRNPRGNSVKSYPTNLFWFCCICASRHVNRKKKRKKEAVMIGHFSAESESDSASVSPLSDRACLISLRFPMQKSSSFFYSPIYLWSLLSSQVNLSASRLFFACRFSPDNQVNKATFLFDLVVFVLKSLGFSVDFKVLSFFLVYWVLWKMILSKSPLFIELKL